MRAIGIILVILSVLAIAPRALAKNDFSPAYGGPTASDQVNQIYIPKFKLQFGADGSATDVSILNAFPVSAVVTSVPLITNYALETGGNLAASKASLASIDSKLANPMPVAQSGTWTVMQGGAPWSVSQSGAWSTGRTWVLSSSTDSIASVQSGNWSQRIQDGSGNLLTSQSNGAQRALDVGIDVAGVQVDPRTRTWNLSSGADSVSASITQTVQDTMPASQNITVQDTASTTTTQANNQSITTGIPTVGSAATFSIASMATVQVTVSGTWTGTVLSEVSSDGSTWLVGGIHQRGTSYSASSFTQNFSGLINTSGIQKYRIRATAPITGTATVLITESINPSSVYVANTLKLSDATTPSTQMSIKAGSTAAQTTDTAVVVSVSPNSPAKIAANTNGSVTNITASTTPTTVSPPANAVGFILESDSTNSVNCRWAVGSTASATVGKLEEPGRDSGYLPMAANISVYCAAPAQTVSVQWVLSQ